MSRFADHWKIAPALAARVPSGAPGESAECAAPVRAKFRGTPIWVHAITAPPASSPFATDDRGLAFLPDDAIANVQLERYMRRDSGEDQGEARLKSLYYFLKPAMPRALQLAAQRANARSRLRRIDYPSWPHDDSLQALLEGFLAALFEIEGTDSAPFIGFWPRGFRWAACLTHDVETSVGLAAIDRMATIEEDLGVRSTWFVVPERYPVSPEDFRELRERGHEIGVHGLNHDCRDFESREEFVRRVPRIDAYLREWGAVGFRSPALYRNADWIPDLDIRYDSSFMDTAHLEPQRGGVSAPFPFFLRGRIVELPITLPMDHHLINLLRRDTVDGMVSKFRWVADRHGLANALFHPDYNLDPSRLRDYRAVVETVCGTPGGWIATAAEVADWWDRRRASTLILDGGEARIEGPAAPDACVWHAHRDGARVRIEPG